ncbi:MAG TPA: hypothetical protein VIL85_08780 [Thermomicrobiales bacterium]|jgi:hypothetical protein
MPADAPELGGLAVADDRAGGGVEGDRVDALGLWPLGAVNRTMPVVSSQSA